MNELSASITVPPPPPPRRVSRALFTAAFVATTAALVFAFHGGLSADATSRALPVLGLSEIGTLSADPWAGTTIEHATVNGHTYSDKAPLASSVLLPFYFVWHLVRGRPYAHPLDLRIAVLVGDVVASAIPFAVYTLLLQRRAARTLPQGEAVTVALLAAFGTPLFHYGGTFDGHSLAGALFAFAYHTAMRRAERAASVAGLLAGLATLAELPTAIVTGILGVYLLVGTAPPLRPGGALASRAPGWKRLLAYVAGGLPCALALFAYNAAITGSPFDPPYHYLPDYFQRAHPYVVNLRTVSIAWRLLFSEYRGLFIYAPALLVLVPLAFRSIEDRAHKALLAAIAVAQIGFVASFWMWDGGWCIGPGRLGGLLMLLLYEGVDAVSRAPRARRAFYALSAAGVGLNLVAVATNPFARREFHPITRLYFPAFFSERIAKDNVFQMIGLDLGAWSVAAWGCLFVLAAAWLGQLAEQSSPGR